MTKYNYKLVIEDTGDVYYYVSYRIAEHNYRVEQNKGHVVRLLAIV